MCWFRFCLSLKSCVVAYINRQTSRRLENRLYANIASPLRTYRSPSPPNHCHHISSDQSIFNLFFSSFSPFFHPTNPQPPKTTSTSTNRITISATYEQATRQIRRRPSQSRRPGSKCQPPVDAT